ncbi:Transcription factor WhiB [Streptomyces sp. 2231.1]|nr:WhiB family transcriptional regulator [Streptomyces sp. 2231.1]SEE40652.1 Transcription factor WhiB [Streptomyces sp. 2231.1]
MDPVQPGQGGSRRVLQLLAGCPVRTECLAEALDNRIEFSVWGGMTERERRALLRPRPDVASWWKVPDDARHGPEQQHTSARPRSRYAADRERPGPPAHCPCSGRRSHWSVCGRRPCSIGRERGVTTTGKR